MQWVWVISFGVLGVSLRFAIDSSLSKFSFSFPFGTLAINVLGCFIAGLLFASGIQREPDPVRLGLVVGFCGGFTTFSGFGIQIIQLINDGRILPAIAYGVASPILCILATAAGLILWRQFA